MGPWNPSFKIQRFKRWLNYNWYRITQKEHWSTEPRWHPTVYAYYVFEFHLITKWNMIKLNSFNWHFVNDPSLIVNNTRKPGIYLLGIFVAQIKKLKSTNMFDIFFHFSCRSTSEKCYILFLIPLQTIRWNTKSCLRLKLFIMLR